MSRWNSIVVCFVSKKPYQPTFFPVLVEKIVPTVYYFNLKLPSIVLLHYRNLRELSTIQLMPLCCRGELGMFLCYTQEYRIILVEHMTRPWMMTGPCAWLFLGWFTEHRYSHLRMKFVSTRQNWKVFWR